MLTEPNICGFSGYICGVDLEHDHFHTLSDMLVLQRNGMEEETGKSETDVAALAVRDVKD